MVGQKGSRGKLSAALGTDGAINKIREKLCSQEVAGKDLLEEVTRVVQLGTSCQDASPNKEELELLRVSSVMRLDDTLYVTCD